MQKLIMPKSDRPKFNKMKNRIKRPLQQKQRHKKSLWQMKLLHWPVYLDWCPSLVRIKRDWQETLTGQQWAKTRLEVRQPNIGILGVNQCSVPLRINATAATKILFFCFFPRQHWTIPFSNDKKLLLTIFLSYSI